MKKRLLAVMLTCGPAVCFSQRYEDSLHEDPNTLEFMVCRYSKAENGAYEDPKIHILAKEFRYMPRPKMITVFSGSPGKAMEFLKEIEGFYYLYPPGVSRFVQGHYIILAGDDENKYIEILPRDNNGFKQYTLKSWLTMIGQLESYIEANNLMNR